MLTAESSSSAPPDFIAASIIPDLQPEIPMLTAALEYARERDWLVFPAPPGTKKSHKSAKHSDGQKWGATSNEVEIRNGYRRWPNANVGVVTGAESGNFVLDTDTPEGHDVDGAASLAALESEHGKLPATLRAISPSGSIHYYFMHPGFKVPNSVSAIAPGVDIRGDGGMVLAPPSVKPDKGVYRWLNDLPIAAAPQWLLDKIKKPEPEVKISQQATARVKASRNGGVGYAKAALASECDILASARPGQRNHQANISAMKMGQLVAAGELSESEVKQVLEDACFKNGLVDDTGLQAVRDTINSGFNKGMQEPREIPEASSHQSSNGEDDADTAQDCHAPAFSEESLALVFANLHQQNLRYVAKWGSWMRWDNVRWAFDETMLAFDLARAVCRKAASTCNKSSTAKAIASAKTVAAVERLAKADRGIAATVDQWDSSPFKFNEGD